MSDFDKAVARVVEEVLPDAKAMAEINKKPLKDMVFNLVKKHVTRYIATHVSGEHDTRTKKWNVSLKFVTLFDDGGDGELLEETEAELVQGFSGVAEYVREFVELVHEKSGMNIDELPMFSREELEHKLLGLRPAISKSGGRAKGHILYEVNHHDYSCVIYLSREGIALTT